MSQYTNAKAGVGASLRRRATESMDSTTGIWIPFAEVTSISWTGPSREVIETFVLDNPTDYVDKLQGVLNPGQVQFNVNYTREQYFDMKQQLETRGENQYQLRLPDGEALEFDGFIAELSLDLGSDDVMQGEATVEITGAPDFVSSATL